MCLYRLRNVCVSVQYRIRIVYGNFATKSLSSLNYCHIDATMFDVIVVAGFRRVTVAQSTLYTATKECFRCIQNKKPSNEFVVVIVAVSVACCSTFTLNPWR